MRALVSLEDHLLREALRARPTAERLSTYCIVVSLAPLPNLGSLVVY